MTSLLALYEEPNYAGRAAIVNSCGNYRTLRKIGFPKNALSSMKIGPGIMAELYDHEGFQGHVRRYIGPSHIPTLGDYCHRTGSIRVLKLNGANEVSGLPLTGVTGPVGPYAPYAPYGLPVGTSGPQGVYGLPPPGITGAIGTVPKVSGVPSPRFDVSPQLFPSHVGSQPIVVPPGSLGATGILADLYGGRRTAPTAILYSASHYRGTSVPITVSREIANITDIGFPSNALSSIKVSPGYVVILYQGPNFTGRSKRISGPAHIPDLGGFNNTVKSLKITSSGSNYQAVANPNWLWWIIIIIIIIVILILIFRR